MLHKMPALVLNVERGSVRAAAGGAVWSRLGYQAKGMHLLETLQYTSIPFLSLKQSQTTMRHSFMSARIVTDFVKTVSFGKGVDKLRRLYFATGAAAVANATVILKHSPQTIEFLYDSGIHLLGLQK